MIKMPECERYKEMHDIVEKCYKRTLMYRICIDTPGGLKCEEVLKDGKCPKLIEYLERCERYGNKEEC